jgi:hypothetical protein
MFKKLLLIFMVACIGCAATNSQDNISVTCPGGEPFYKTQYAPLDFPNELFVAYSCRRSKVNRHDLNNDGQTDIIWNVYYDKNGKAEAWWVLRILQNEKRKATTWTFIKKLDGGAKIIWENKELEKWQKEWVDGFTTLINEELAAQEK